MGREEEGPRSFARFIEDVADGDAHAQLSEELFELAGKLQSEALSRDAKIKGSLSLMLKLEAQPNGMVTIAYDIKRKDPAKRTSQGVCWLTGGGNLTHKNPRQEELPHMREVKPGREAAREIAQASAKEV